MALDTAAFDRKFESLLELGYRDLKLPVPVRLFNVLFVQVPFDFLQG